MTCEGISLWSAYPWCDTYIYIIILYKWNNFDPNQSYKEGADAKWLLQTPFDACRLPVQIALVATKQLIMMMSCSFPWKPSTVFTWIDPSGLKPRSQAPTPAPARFAFVCLLLPETSPTIAYNQWLVEYCILWMQTTMCLFIRMSRTKTHRTPQHCMSRFSTHITPILICHSFSLSLLVLV